MVVFIFFQIVSGSLSESADSLLRNISKQTKNNNDHEVTQVFFFSISYTSNWLPQSPQFREKNILLSHFSSKKNYTTHILKKSNLQH